MTVVATSTSSPPDRNASMACSLSAGFIWPCRRPDPQPGELVRRPAARPRRWPTPPRPGRIPRPAGRPRRPGGRTPPARAPAPTPPRPRAGCAATRSTTGWRPGGSSSMTVMSRSPKTTMAAVRGMGVAVMTSRSGSLPRPVVAPALVAQGGPLLDAEAVLLVDDHHAERAEDHLVGEQGVGADQQVDRAVGQTLVDRGPLGGAGAAGEQRDPQRALPGQRGRDRAPSARRRAVGPRRRAARPAPRSAPSGRPGARPRPRSASRPRPPPSCRSRRRPGAGGAWAAGRPRSPRQVGDGPGLGPGQRERAGRR